MKKATFLKQWIALYVSEVVIKTLQSGVVS